MDLQEFYRKLKTARETLESVEGVTYCAVDSYTWTGAITAIAITASYEAGADRKREQFERKLTHDQIDAGEHVDAWARAALADLHAWINEIPTPEELEQQAFNRAVATVLERGRDIGIDADTLDPIRALMQRLATNALEDKRGKVDGIQH